MRSGWFGRPVDLELTTQGGPLLGGEFVAHCRGERMLDPLVTGRGRQRWRVGGQGGDRPCVGGQGIDPALQSAEFGSVHLCAWRLIRRGGHVTGISRRKLESLAINLVEFGLEVQT